MVEFVERELGDYKNSQFVLEIWDDGAITINHLYPDKTKYLFLPKEIVEKLYNELLYWHQAYDNGVDDECKEGTVGLADDKVSNEPSIS